MVSQIGQKHRFKKVRGGPKVKPNAISSHSNQVGHKDLLSLTMKDSTKRNPGRLQCTLVQCVTTCSQTKSDLSY